MPGADEKGEFTKAHFDAIKACVEVAEDTDNVIWDTANEGIRLLLLDNPQWRDLSKEDQSLYDRIKRAFNRYLPSDDGVTSSDTGYNDILNALHERLTRS